MSRSAPLPEVVDDDRTVLVGDPRDLDRVGRLDEPDLREVGRVDPEHDRGPALGERAVEVGGARPVRRPDLDQARARPAHDLGDPHATADLDQLPARHRDAAAPGEPDRERERRRVVDRDERVLGAGQGDEVRLRGTEARASAALVSVVFEQRVPARRPHRRLDRLGRPRGATEVRMEDHAGGIEDRRQPGQQWIHEGGQADADLGRQRLDAGGRVAGRQSRALVGHDLAGHGGQRVGIGPGRGLPPDGSQQPLDARRSRAIRRHVPSMAGTRGSRTHRAAPSAAPLVLKTRGPTGTRPLPARW